MAGVCMKTLSYLTQTISQILAPRLPQPACIRRQKGAYPNKTHDGFGCNLEFWRTKLSRPHGRA